MRLVYFSPVSWFSFSQRPHRFVEWFRQRHRDAQVLWVEPYPTRLPILSDLRRGNDCVVDRSSPGCTPKWLEVISPKALPVEPLPLVGKVNRLLYGKVVEKASEFLLGRDGLVVIGKPSDLALAVLDRLPSVLSVYDAMDDFPAFYSGVSRLSMRYREKSTVAQVTRVLVSSSHTLERFAGAHSDIRLVLNACDTSALPEFGDGGHMRIGSVIGYVGTIGPWFDWSFVVALARVRPDMAVRLIGPIHGTVPTRLPGNIELHPALEHKAAMQALGSFSVGLIPFQRTPLTASVDPIKYYEYRGMGIPVMSTVFGEMALRRDEPGVFLVDNVLPESLCAALGRAIAWQDSERGVLAFRVANSWAARFDASGLA